MSAPSAKDVGIIETDMGSIEIEFFRIRMGHVIRPQHLLEKFAEFHVERRAIGRRAGIH